ncbi:N-acetylglucosamine kinase [Virgibacillus salexigens]|uniref:N-acetylglucosamine kinase n=1 Tax=Virgibacillus massiliensis TaxID=1462526 RepID=UPI00136D9838|nr:BadF/BadG/BcrA/BcrD ATPase family protein [Virgibacillus massiliensis]MYL40295.1 hypothetical protein [Virgibacillus massiliensis]
MSYIIGIDGGGTKTLALLADLEGNIISTCITGPSNPNTVSSRALSHTFETIFSQFKEEAPEAFSKLIGIFAGIAGAGSSMIQTQLYQLLDALSPSACRVTVQPDAINALYSGTLGKPGVVQISGTGSLTFGINENQQQSRIGGWGYLLGDEGSGYDIGKKGIAAALHYLDGKINETMLLKMLYDYFHVDTGRDLTDQIYHNADPKRSIASVCRLVFQAYQSGDKAASIIIDDAAWEIARNIHLLHKRLFSVGEQINVVVCGGVFQNSIFPTLIKQELNKIVSGITVITPKLPPVCGSVIGAYLSEDMNISTDSMNRLQNFQSNK